jgi:hypothetical protein
MDGGKVKMGDINYSRYVDSIGLSGWDKKTFLNQWYRKGLNWFNDYFKTDWELYGAISGLYYSQEVDKGRHGMDVVGDEKYKNIEKKYCPIERHRIVWWFINIPHKIEMWLCCGWKLHYDKEIHQWTYIDKYHMMSKLCRYGHPWWPDYKFTWWDKLRFKWITGYEYEVT